MAKGLDQSIELEWFDTWLKGQRTRITDTDTPMHLFEMGSSWWFDAATYPLVDRYTPLFLGSAGSLADRPPSHKAHGKILPAALHQVPTQSRGRPRTARQHAELHDRSLPTGCHVGRADLRDGVRGFEQQQPGAHSHPLGCRS